jgi:hypothetical protein
MGNSRLFYNNIKLFQKGFQPRIEHAEKIMDGSIIDKKRKEITDI